jgi:hypothetical protein
MHTPNLSAITQLMRGSIDRMQRAGAIRSREDRIVKLQDVFPFEPGDVSSISYAEKAGGGNGICFHLHNGRIFDEFGKPHGSDKG